MSLHQVPALDVTSGRIYRADYHKRLDARAVEGEAILQRARLVGGELSFSSDARRAIAFEEGVFLLEVPSDFEFGDADLFSEQFYRGADALPFGSFRDVDSSHFGDPLLGFHERSNQIEQFLLERRFWGRDYPAKIAEVGERLTAMSAAVLRSVLEHLGIPPEDWRRATGGCSDGEGAYHLTFNHYRPQMGGIGLASHKDDGFLTILRTRSRGLELSRREVWEAAPVDPGCFVVNFGLSMEILTSGCKTPVKAIMHRVAHQAADRSSFGHFTSSDCRPGSEEGIYRFLPGLGLERICGSRELIDANDREIYLGTDQPEE